MLPAQQGKARAISHYPLTEARIGTCLLFFHLCDPLGPQEVRPPACRKEPPVWLEEPKQTHCLDDHPWGPHILTGESWSVSIASSCCSKGSFMRKQKLPQRSYAARLSLPFDGGWLRWLKNARSWFSHEQLGIGEYKMLHLLKMNC